MRHLAAYLMLVIGGNTSPSAEDVTNALAAAGVDVDEERLNTLIAELDGKDMNELIELGKEKLMVGGGGGGGDVTETQTDDVPEKEIYDGSLNICWCCENRHLFMKEQFGCSDGDY